MKCLDTNAIIALLNDRPFTARKQFTRELEIGEPIAVSVITLVELAYGFEKGTRREQNYAALRALLTLGIGILHFDAEDAKQAGLIRSILERAGTPIGNYDILIAAQALRRGAVLVTANRREFERVPGLMVTDWPE